MTYRRNFIRLVGATGLVLLLPRMQPADPYDAFLARVERGVHEIVQAQGRGVRKLSIDPPKASPCGRYFTRRVNVRLEPGPSLLDQQAFQFDVVSGSRWDGR